MQCGNAHQQQITVLKKCFKSSRVESFFEAPLLTKQFLHASSFLLTFSFPSYSWGTWSIYILLRHQPSNCTRDAQQWGPSTQLSWYSQSQLCMLLTRWTAGRRHVDGFTFAAIPTEQTREERTHPVLPSSVHTHSGFLSAGCSTALPGCALGSTESQKWGSEPVLLHPLRPKGELHGMKD